MLKCSVGNIFDYVLHFPLFQKMDESASAPKFSFKSSKKRQMRKRQDSSETEEDTTEEFNKQDYEKTRELQKLR